MQPFWKAINQSLSILCEFALVFLTAAAVLLVQTDRVLLNANTYKNILVKQQVYQRMPRILAEQVVTALNGNACGIDPLMCGMASAEFVTCVQSSLGDERYSMLASGAGEPTEGEAGQVQACLDRYDPTLQARTSNKVLVLLTFINVDTLETLIAAMLPPEELQALTENTLDQAFAYANGEQAAISLSFANVKQELAGPAGLQAILKLDQEQPACSSQYLLAILAGLKAGNVSLSLCRLPDELLALAAPLIQEVLKEAAAQIPNSQVISPQFGALPAGLRWLGNGPAGWIRLARLGMRLSPELPLLVLILMTVLVVRTPKGLLRWWGIPVFFSGLLCAGLAFAVNGFFDPAWALALANRLPQSLSPSLVILAHGMVKGVLYKVSIGTGVSGAILVVVGAGMWIGSAFIKNGNGPEDLSASGSAAE